MSASRWIESQGVRVQVEDDKIILDLKALGQKHRAEVLAFARQNKKKILEEVGDTSTSTTINLKTNRDLMRQYPHLAPCYKSHGHWVYRGQACTDCRYRFMCTAWPVGEKFSTELPFGIVAAIKKSKGIRMFSNRSQTIFQP